MRELLLKNFVSKDKRRSELFLSEHFENEGMIQEIEKKTVYKIKEILEFTDTFDLELFLEQKQKHEFPTQRFIIKNRTTRTGTVRFFYKVIGEHYVVINDKVLVVKASQYVKKTAIHKGKNKELISEKLP